MITRVRPRRTLTASANRIRGSLEYHTVEGYNREKVWPAVGPDRQCFAEKPLRLAYIFIRL